MHLRSFLWLILLALLPSLAVMPARASETAAEHAANVYADHELRSHPLHTNVPDYSLPPEKLAKAQHLSTIRVTLHFASVVWSVLEVLLLLATGAVAGMRDRAATWSPQRWLQGFAFVLLFLGALTLLNLPIGIYAHHLSRVYGFSVQGWPGWAWDQAKSFALTWLCGSLIVLLLFWIIGRLPRTWWLAFWVALLPITVCGAFLGPYVSYMFYKHQPLAQSHPALVAQLETVVAKGHMDIPPERMFLMKASEKETVPNAMVEGFGASKRVVVWDTAITLATPDEITYIFGHESGHYVLHHVARGMAEGFAGSLLVLWLCFVFVQWAIARFGAAWRIPSQHDWAALAVLMLALSIVSVLAEPVVSTLSRQKEHAADVYGQEAIHGLVADPQAVAQHAEDVLGEATLSDPNPSPFFEFWSFSHPSSGRRAAFAHAYDPWAAGMMPKYFGNEK